MERELNPSEEPGAASSVRPGAASRSWKRLVGAGILAAAGYVALAAPNLTAQGLQYDELYQGPAALAFVGREPEFFVALKFQGIPLLNMTYCGALKSALYGLYLRVTQSSFGARSWRLLGIVLVGLGLFVFCIVARSSLTRLGFLVFLLLLLTDTSFLLLTRFDYGATNLAAMFRLVFLGVWIRSEMQGTARPRTTFALGALVGIAIFDKLSSVVLVGPLLLYLMNHATRRTARHTRAWLAGGLLGGFPLVFANVLSAIQSGQPISLTGLANEPPQLSAGGLAFRYLGLGHGRISSSMLGRADILPVQAQELLAQVDFCLVVSLLLLVAGMSWMVRRQHVAFRLAGSLLLGYGLVWLVLFLLPRRTLATHWLLGTPFQYAALSLLLVGLQSTRGLALAGKRLLARIFSVAIVLLLVLRLGQLVIVESLLIQGSYSPQWDPSLTRLGSFAKEQAGRAVFIAADWGVATQIYCLSDGLPGIVHEPFWNYAGPRQLRDLLQGSDRKVAYLATLDPHSGVNPENTARIFKDMFDLPGWKRVPLDPELRGLQSVRVLKFVRARPRRDSGDL